MLQLGSKQVRNIHPRNQSRRGTSRDACRYFHDTGKCAFGTRCSKEHDARLFSDQALSSLRDADTDVRQQLTLHLVSIPEKYEERDIIKVCVSSPTSPTPPLSLSDREMAGNAVIFDKLCVIMLSQPFFLLPLPLTPPPPLLLCLRTVFILYVSDLKP